MINYQLIQDSIEYYEKAGFPRIEAPWWISRDIADITKPDDVEDFYIKKNKKTLVASGEQSFLYMANKGRLIPGQYQCTTPCFRDESIGRLHRKCFIKTELIKTDIVNEEELKKIIDTSFKFFCKYIDKSLLEIIKTDIGYDIQTINGKELGSYGIRECEFLKWIYATACAEPRLSRIMNNP